jgi:hypothetical protein
MNSPIMPNEGVFIYTKLSKEKFVERFKENLQYYEVVSAIGHEATAKYLSKLLNYPVEVNRTTIEFQDDDMALVIKIKTRLPEGKVLSEEELENIEVEFGSIYFRPHYYSAYI